MKGIKLKPKPTSDKAIRDWLFVETYKGVKSIVPKAFDISVGGAPCDEEQRNFAIVDPILAGRPRLRALIYHIISKGLRVDTFRWFDDPFQKLQPEFTEMFITVEQLNKQAWENLHAQVARAIELTPAAPVVAEMGDNVPLPRDEDLNDYRQKAS